MPKAQHIGVEGVARKVGQPYIGVDGVARAVKSGYVGVDGVARQFFEGLPKVSELAVGASLYTKVNGTSMRFLVVHQGNPSSSTYDSSCDGTWLLMYNAYAQRVWGSTNNYSTSGIHSYLNNGFLDLFEPTIQNAIKQVKIPYYAGKSGNNEYFLGANGLSTKIFLLGYKELGIDPPNGSYGFPSADGKKLDYFVLTDATLKSAQWRAYNTSNNSVNWYTRTPYYDGSNYGGIILLKTDGSRGSMSLTNSTSYFRPAFILPKNAKYDPVTNTLVGL